ncbi:MAG: ABC transporter ATP-binding protein/permease [Lachnospiraceae bacterium]|nr:ABC transporter ATP-binding protein/permease [Lachnospiraceae bacterium]
MKSLLKYLRNYKKESVLAPLFKLLEASFELFVPIVISKIIDDAIPSGDNSMIIKMGLVLVGLALVGMVAAITAQFFAAKAAVGFSTELRSAVFAHIQTLDFTSLDKTGTSTLITRMTSDINQLQNGVNMVLRLFLRSPIVVFGAMIMAFTIDVKSALVFVVAIPLLAIVVYGIMLITMPLYKKVQGGLDKILSHTRENLTGVRVIRAFNLEEKELDNFESDNRLLAKSQTHVGRFSALTNPLTYIIVNGAIIVLIYVGGVQVNIGNLTQGQVVAIINYMSQILVELIKLANLIVLMTKAAACGDRVSDVLKMENKPVPGKVYGSENTEVSGKADSESNTKRVVSDDEYLVFDHVGLTYEGAGAETLTDINFKVKKGQTIGVIGGTGSGKSSLVNMIPALYPSTKGSIRLNGRDLKDYTDDELRSKIGVVPQKAMLFKGTIRSNLLWGKPDATDEELWKALEKAQATEVVKGKEGELDAEVEQNGRNFSGGQKQRLTIARALVGNPEILILDDSASALDYATDARLRKAVSGIQGSTVFIVSQRASSIRNADQIIVLDDGEVAGIGSNEELLETCEVYKEIYYSQYEKES